MSFPFRRPAASAAVTRFCPCRTAGPPARQPAHRLLCRCFCRSLYQGERVPTLFFNRVSLTVPPRPSLSNARGRIGFSGVTKAKHGPCGGGADVLLNENLREVRTRGILRVPRVPLSPRRCLALSSRLFGISFWGGTRTEQGSSPLMGVQLDLGVSRPKHRCGERFHTWISWGEAEGIHATNP